MDQKYAPSNFPNNNFNPFLTNVAILYPHPPKKTPENQMENHKMGTLGRDDLSHLVPENLCNNIYFTSQHNFNGNKT